MYVAKEISLNIGSFNVLKGKIIILKSRNLVKAKTGFFRKLRNTSYTPLENLGKIRHFTPILTP